MIYDVTYDNQQALEVENQNQRVEKNESYILIIYDGTIYYFYLEEN